MSEEQIRESEISSKIKSLQNSIKQYRLCPGRAIGAFFQVLLLFFFLMIFIFSIIFGLQCSVNSTVQQSDPVTHTYIHSFSHIIFHHVPSQVTRYSSQYNKDLYRLEIVAFVCLCCEYFLPVCQLSFDFVYGGFAHAILKVLCSPIYQNFTF